MLFHITLVHDAAHCPGYHPELMPKLAETLAKKDVIAQRFGVKIHSFLEALPEHATYVIAEAEAPMALARLVTELLPFEMSEIRVTPVTTADELVSFLQSMEPPSER